MPVPFSLQGHIPIARQFMERPAPHNPPPTVEPLPWVGYSSQRATMFFLNAYRAAPLL
jgi:hypothetical protein